MTAEDKRAKIIADQAAREAAAREAAAANGGGSNDKQRGRNAAKRGFRPPGRPKADG